MLHLSLPSRTKELVLSKQTLHRRSYSTANASARKVVMPNSTSVMSRRMSQVLSLPTTLSSSSTSNRLRCFTTIQSIGSSKSHHTKNHGGGGRRHYYYQNAATSIESSSSSVNYHNNLAAFLVAASVGTMMTSLPSSSSSASASCEGSTSKNGEILGDDHDQDGDDDDGIYGNKDVEENLGMLKKARNIANIKNPLWPSGVPEEDVDALVEELLQDPSINIRAVPDVIERRLYKSTIQITLNLFYGWLSWLQGLPLLSHEIRISREKVSTVDGLRLSLKSSRGKNSTADSPDSDGNEGQWQGSMIDEKILEEVADRLLTNPNINVGPVPDAMEREVYKNCLKIIFRLLCAVADSFKISICGHDVHLLVEPTATAIGESMLRATEKMETNDETNKDGPKENDNDDDKKKESNSNSNNDDNSKKAFRARSSLTTIDTELLYKFAQASGVPENGKEFVKEDKWSIFEKMYVSRHFVVAAHAALYTLILAIVDDVLANTKIQILSDDIILDIVPASPLPPSPPPTTAGDVAGSTDRKGNNQQNGGGGSLVTMASFTAGFGAGLICTALLMAQQQQR